MPDLREDLFIVVKHEPNLDAKVEGDSDNERKKSHAWMTMAVP